MNYHVIIRGVSVGVRIMEVPGRSQEKNKHHALRLLENCSLTVVEQKISGPFYHTKYGTVNPLFRLKIKNKVLKKNSLL